MALYRIHSFVSTTVYATYIRFLSMPRSCARCVRLSEYQLPAGVQGSGPRGGPGIAAARPQELKFCRGIYALAELHFIRRATKRLRSASRCIARPDIHATANAAPRANEPSRNFKYVKQLEDKLERISLWLNFKSISFIYLFFIDTSILPL